MLRAYAALDATFCGSVLMLDPEETHHLVKVRRVRVGETVEVLNGQGGLWTCEFVETHGKEGLLKVLARKFVSPPPVATALAQALPTGKTMETIIQKATELGVRKMIPLRTTNCEVRLEAERADHKVEKYRQIALEACKQCGNPWLPVIEPVTRFPHFVEAEARKNSLHLLAALTPQARELRDLLPPTREAWLPEICWLVGPEGDFTPTEYHALQLHGWQAVTLGPCILRADTAALAALSLLLYEIRLRGWDKP